MKKSLLIIFLYLPLLLSSCTKKDRFVSEKAKYDIELVKVDINSYIMKDLYNPEPLEKLENDLINRNISRNEAVIRLSKILSDYNVVHLNLNINYPDFYSKNVPVLLKNFGNDFYINITTKEYQKYLGWKVIELGNNPVNQALDKYNQFFSNETPTGAKYNFEKLLNYNFLKAAGLLNKNGTLTLVLSSPEGKKETIKCKSIKKFTADNIAYLQEKATTPVYINRTKNTVAAVEADPAKKIYYFQTFGFDEYKTNNFSQCVDQMIQELNTNEYETIVFDMRYNSGGSLFNTMGYQTMIYNHKEVLSNYKLAVAISGKTYSAAVIFINYLYGIFPDITFFGEETGQAIFNYTDVIPETLPNLKCHINFPRSVEPMKNVEKRANDIYRGIMPDVEVHETLDDYLKGQDTVYKAIYEYFN